MEVWLDDFRTTWEDDSTAGNPMTDDPRNVLLMAGEAIQRYRWGQTRGYQKLKDRKLVPPAGRDESESMASRSSDGMGRPEICRGGDA